MKELFFFFLRIKEAEQKQLGMRATPQVLKSEVLTERVCRTEKKNPPREDEL